MDGAPVRVAPDGRFAIGFPREADTEAELEITRPDGTAELRTLSIAPREFDIQRIDGLPESKVTPPQSVLDRLAREKAMVAKARDASRDALYWTEPFIWPARGRISGVYGSQRILNGTPKWPHYGVDVAAPAGTPVVAPGSGTVTLAEKDFYYEGGIVIIDHGYGITSTLFHMQRVDVKAGDSVTKGDQIGAVGAAGRATGPHVDWRINWNDVRIDPQLLMEEPPEND